jgi:sulfoxide reductase heme-binding subunit YedZ
MAATPQTLTRRRNDAWLHLVHPVALAPGLHLAFDASQGQLSVNPIQDLTLRTGYAALVLLMLSLAATPLNLIFGWKWALKLRRPLGLYAFGYAAVHMLIFVGLDYGFNAELIWQDVAEKRYIIAGSAALLLLTPLAITSTKGWQRRLGKDWKRLHRLVYLAAILAVTHYLWLVKSDLRPPLVFAVILGLLLTLRTPWVKDRITGLRRRVGVR